MLIAKVRSFFQNPEGVKLLILFDSKYGLGDLFTTGVPAQSLPDFVEGSGNSFLSLRCLSINQMQAKNFKQKKPEGLKCL